MDASPTLPSSVTHFQLEGREIYLVGTAHVSHQSVEDVAQTLEHIQPDCVCVELCPSRYQAMTDPSRWKKMDIFQIVREGKASFLLGQLILSSFYQRLGDQLGIEPGAEMLKGAQLSEEMGAELVLADRAVDITLKRVWGHLSFWNKMKLLFQGVGSFFSGEEIEAEEIDKMREEGNLEGMMELFSQEFPQVKERLIDERDIYLAQKIRSSEGKKVVAVVGAGHVPGIQQHILKKQPLQPLEVIPKGSLWGKVCKWMIPLLIFFLPLMGFLGGVDRSIESLWVWTLSHSLLAALGATLAWAHPLAILASSLSAPLTSLNPMLAAGWIGGMVQLWIKKPTVADLEALPQAITSLGGFWRNPVTRILLVVALANLGSSLGTLLSGAWIFSHLV